MSYQNIQTPRFYVDLFSYFNALGMVQHDNHFTGWDYDLNANRNIFSIGLNPTNQGSWDYDLAPTGSTTQSDRRFVTARTNRTLSTSLISNPKHGKTVYGLLGHNFRVNELSPRLKLVYVDNNGNQHDSYGQGSEIINWTQDDKPNFDGFSLYETSHSLGSGLWNRIQLRLLNRSSLQNLGTAKCGSIFVGTYYDMPHSPDLNLNLSYEYDGINQTQTKGGATLSNALYTKPADWGTLDTKDYADTPRTLGCWQLESPTDGILTSENYRNGRRVWDLSFSFMSDTDIMPSNATTNNKYPAYRYSSSQMQNVFGYEQEHIQTAINDENAEPINGAFRENIHTSQDFFSQVWNRTMGGHLPFIFQPNNIKHLADQFAICRFDMNSLQLNQIGHNLYNMQIRIRESW
tara:strand:- start:1420 stop:2631 length:1212 start_codon:yes stop_codon:yes gene_type:complete